MTDVMQPLTHAFEPTLRIYLLGTVDFDAVVRLQRRLHFDVTGDRERAALILCEHRPVITVGRQGSRANIRIPDEELLHRGWSVRWVSRGGGTILHVPGQLAVYPVLSLPEFGLSVTQYLRRLSETASRVLADFSVVNHVQRVPGGVAVRDRLLAATGIAVRDWVSTFGIYFNLGPDLELLRGIRCTRRDDEPMTSLIRERGGPVRPAMAKQRLLEHFQSLFGIERTEVFSSHPMLQAEQTDVVTRTFVGGDGIPDASPPSAGGVR